MIKQKESVRHLYVHFPFCKSKCAYCGFYSVVLNSECFDSVYTGYLRSLKAELTYYALEYDLSHLETIFIGGGSPSLNTLFIKDFNTILCDTLTDCVPNVKISSGKSSADDFLTEFTIECNPTQITESFISESLACGVNRFSMGVQSFCQTSLDRFGRHQTVKDVFNALDLFQHFYETGAIFSLNIDLINHLMLTDSDVDNGMLTLNNILNQYVFINHISVYDLTFDEGSRIYSDKSLFRDFTRSESVADYYWQRIGDVLHNEGFVQYEVSNYCRQGYECRHNLGYWLYRNYIGLGPSAHSTIGDMRIENHRDVGAYINDWKAARTATRLTMDERIEEFLLMNLRLLNRPLDMNGFCKRFGIKLTDIIPMSVKKYQEIGWLTKDYAVTPLGMNFLNTMLTDMFDEINK